jgi:TRAP-type C4-dicarboxylate transport system substrate-binding protein
VRGLFAITFALFTFAQVPEARADRSWIFGSIAPEGSVYADGSEEVARAIEGAVPNLRIKRRFAGILGDEIATVRILQKGRIELFTGSLGAVVDLVPELRVLELPYLFRDDATLYAAVKRFERGRRPELQKAVAARGLVLLSLSALGWRNVASLGAPIRTAQDLKGLRVRSQAADVHHAMWRAYGATPVDTPLNNLSQDLKAKELAALDIPVTFLFGTSAHELVRSVTLTRHIPQFVVLLASKPAWDALPAAERARAIERIDKITARAEQRASQFDDELLGMLEKRGVALIRPTPKEAATFHAPVSSLVTSLGKLTATERAILASIKRAIAGTE